MRRIDTPRIALVLVLSLTFSSCLLLAGAGVGYVVSQEVLPNSVHETQVADDVDHVWKSVRETTDILADLRAETLTNDFPRRIETTIDGATVKIEVEAHDIDRTLIRVTAEKYLAADSATAEKVMNKLIQRLRK